VRPREPQVAHFAGLDKFRQRPYGLLNRDTWIDAALAIAVDVLDAQTRQRDREGDSEERSCDFIELVASFVKQYHGH
jgi:hypothetical protein